MDGLRVCPGIFDLDGTLLDSGRTQPLIEPISKFTGGLSIVQWPQAKALPGVNRLHASS
ncbi:hypothetical protein HPP92_008029 [Vanilla planifolia]|uniref:Uncharacterized protein n=1 Tax=Vanilla planifolia TaxID=51239 RepID=A0A835V9A5_VANPL|nr:hypothetical protein HPP92_008029 [Vanilla planifolia]